MREALAGREVAGLFWAHSGEMEMDKVVTVRGLICPDALGFTTMHEHLFLDGHHWCDGFKRRYPDVAAQAPVNEDEPLCLENLGAARRNPERILDEMRLDDEEHTTSEVAEYKTAGGAAILETSAPGIRIMTDSLKRVSEATGVHIIASTGLYAEPSWPDCFRSMTLEQYADHFRSELISGIGETGVRAGHIKLAVVDDISQQQETVIRAAARVSAETGVSVTVHPGFAIGNDGRAIAKILKDEGMNLERLILAHASASFIRTTNLKARILYPEATWGLTLDYADEMLSLGVTLSIDCFGHMWELEHLSDRREEDWQRLAGLVALLRRGYAEQLVLGIDVFLKSLTRRYGGEGYRHLPEAVIPILKDCGVSDCAVRHMTVGNPARLLAWSSS